MKQIILGQLLIWVNMLSVIGGYLIIRGLSMPFNEYMWIVLGVIGAVGSGANLVFAICTQVDGYQKLKILPQ